MMIKLSLSLMLVISGAAAAQQPAARSAASEIDQLFVQLQQSGCEFYRNGSWHGASEASTHLRRKYDYLLERNLAPSAESFIDRAASRSSMSGKPYLVRCGSSEPVESGQWFRDRLRDLRARNAGAGNASKSSPLRGTR